MALVPLNPPAPDTFTRRLPWDAPPVLKYWHLTGLDAPSVAVTWAAAFAWAAHVRDSAWQLAVLFLLVWTFYVADRLFDARGGRHLLQERHHFHWRHRRILVVLAAAAAAVSAWLIGTRLPPATLDRDAVVGVATLAYFTGVHSRRRIAPWLERAMACICTREAVVGVIFSAGCLLPAAATGHALAVLSAVAAPAVAFAALAWLNVKAIGHWEDPRMPAGVCRLALAVVAGAGALALSVAWIQPRSAILLLSAAVSALLIAGLDRQRDWISAVGLRAAADLVLLTPMVIVLFVMVLR